MVSEQLSMKFYTAYRQKNVGNFIKYFRADTTVIRDLVKNNDINFLKLVPNWDLYDDIFKRPLFFELEYSDSLKTWSFILNKSDLNLKDDFGGTLLHLCKHSFQVKLVIDKMLQHNISLTSENSEGLDALSIYLKDGSYLCIKEMIDHVEITDTNLWISSKHLNSIVDSNWTLLEYFYKKKPKKFWNYKRSRLLFNNLLVYRIKYTFCSSGSKYLVFLHKLFDELDKSLHPNIDYCGDMIKYDIDLTRYYKEEIAWINHRYHPVGFIVLEFIGIPFDKQRIK
jgi:hypothetical protein